MDLCSIQLSAFVQILLRLRLSTFVRLAGNQTVGGVEAPKGEGLTDVEPEEDASKLGHPRTLCSSHNYVF